MNNNVSTPESVFTKANLYKILSYALCFLLGLAIVIGVKSCARNASMPEAFKEAKSLLKNEGYSIRYIDSETKIEDLLNELDINANGVNKILIAFHENSEDMFLIAYCDDVSTAEDLEFELSWELAKDDYLYYRGYTIKVNYRTVYFGHTDIISTLLK
ncbi:MAG: hypothetical protein IKT56_05470 [Clostridia bacterium]|nr:hypothetical protein [Clostridia bacterium]